MAVLPRQASQGPPPSKEYLAENVGPQLLAIDCTLFGIAMITVILRVYVRVFMLKTFGADDWLMLVAAALSCTSTALFVLAVHYGMGRHVEYVAMNMPNYLELFKVLYFYAIFIIFAYSFIKLSIGMFLLRLAERTWKKFMIGVICFLIVFTIASTFSIIFQCIPVSAGWDLTARTTAKCYPTNVFRDIGVFNSSINIATDLLFAIVPIPLIWNLQVNKRTKISLAVILSLGFFASATAIIKTPMQYNFFKNPDFTGTGSWYYIWQQVEMDVGIIAACLPTLKPLFLNALGQVRALTSGSRSTPNASKPFGSRGYMKQSSGQDHSQLDFKDAIPMRVMSPPVSAPLQNAQGLAHPTNPFSPEQTQGRDSYAFVNKQAQKDRPSQDSEESMWPLQGPRRDQQILKTMEVSVI